MIPAAAGTLRTIIKKKLKKSNGDPGFSFMAAYSISTTNKKETITCSKEKSNPFF